VYTPSTSVHDRLHPWRLKNHRFLYVNSGFKQFALCWLTNVLQIDQQVLSNCFYDAQQIHQHVYYAHLINFHVGVANQGYACLAKLSSPFTESRYAPILYASSIDTVPCSRMVPSLIRTQFARKSALRIHIRLRTTSYRPPCCVCPQSAMTINECCGCYASRGNRCMMMTPWRCCINVSTGASHWTTFHAIKRKITTYRIRLWWYHFSTVCAFVDYRPIRQLDSSVWAIEQWDNNAGISLSSTCLGVTSSVNS